MPPASRIRIRPTRHALGLLGVLTAMLYAGLSQNNAAAYLLAFFTIAVVIVSIVHAWANLRGIELRAEPIDAVYEGEARQVTLLLKSANGRSHSGLQVSGADGAGSALLDELPPLEGARVTLALPSPKRGRFDNLRLELRSTYPLGVFSVRQEFSILQRHFVFPRPEGELPLPMDEKPPRDLPAPAHSAGDDFAGVRDWRAGDSMRHVDWKAVARGQRTMVKQWAGGVSAHFQFRADALEQLPPELRWRQLARWIVQATRLGAAYELELPHARVPVGQGEQHLETCLCRLAEAPRGAETATAR